MNTPIKVTYTRCRLNKPLVTLDGGCFNGVDATPEQLLVLSEQLRSIAHVSNLRPTEGRHWAPSVTFVGREKSEVAQ